MKKPIVLVLILFAVYSIGVVFYYNQDQIKTEVSSLLTKFQNVNESTNSNDLSDFHQATSIPVSEVSPYQGQDVLISGTCLPDKTDPANKNFNFFKFVNTKVKILTTSVAKGRITSLQGIIVDENFKGNNVICNETNKFTYSFVASVKNLKDSFGNEVIDATPVVVSPSNNDISKVFDTPVDSSRSKKIPLQSMLQNNIFKNAVTLAFLLFALIQWINYAANFSPENALKEIIVPAMASFLALKWDIVLSWFMIGL